MCELARAFEPTIKRLAPHLYEEIQGIAEGSGLDIEAVLALNARSEIAFGTLDDGCTSLGWTLPTGDGSGPPRQILAQNWDWTKAVGNNLAMVSIASEGNPKIWMVMEVCLYLVP